jgi:hypothetical protein
MMKNQLTRLEKLWFGNKNIGLVCLWSIGYPQSAIAHYIYKVERSCGAWRSFTCQILYEARSSTRINQIQLCEYTKSHLAKLASKPLHWYQIGTTLNCLYTNIGYFMLYGPYCWIKRVFKTRRNRDDDVIKEISISYRNVVIVGCSV